MEKEFYTPNEVAKKLGVSWSTIISFIYAGELEASNVATPGSTMPRWKISKEALASFIKRTSSIEMLKELKNE